VTSADAGALVLVLVAIPRHPVVAIHVGKHLGFESVDLADKGYAARRELAKRRVTELSRYARAIEYRCSIWPSAMLQVWQSSPRTHRPQDRFFSWQHA
jgi:hypothetical protein